MEFEQLQKRVEWLDEERRSDKKTITELQKRIAKLEGMLDKSAANAKELSSEVTRVGVLIAKVEDFEATMSSHRAEVRKELKEQETQLKQREKEAKKMQASELDSLNKAIQTIQVDLPVLKKEVAARKEEDDRLDRLTVELRQEFEAIRRAEEDRNQAVRQVEENTRQEAKRMTDLQGEMAALRKRTDEHKAKMELAADGQRKIDTRLNELLAAENERREAQSAFLQKVTGEQDARDKMWKEWNSRFETVEKQSERIAALLQEIDATDRAVKRAQQTFEEMSTQLERRIKEVTEIQRLGEERSRQDWSTFKADDQKRWTNYTLAQDEKQREGDRRVERLSGQMTDLEDNLQEMQDVVTHLSEQYEKWLQTLLTNLRDWAAENERFLGTVGR